MCLRFQLASVFLMWAYSLNSALLISKGFIRSRSQIMRLSITMSGPPPEPRGFGKYFKLPSIQKELKLEALNRHEKDNNIKFDSESHTYRYKGKPISTSVTQVVESFFEKFEPDAVIEKMMAGPNWPRPMYLNPEGEPMTEEEIKMKWDMQALYGRNYGSWFHYNVELYLNDEEYSPTLPEMKQFLEFQDTVMREQEITPFRTEWRIAAPEEGIAGSVDFVGKYSDGTYCIMDWKTMKGLPEKINSNYGKFAKPPLEALGDCEGMKYALQLNLYKYILEKYYDITVKKLILAAFNKSMDTYYCVDIPEMSFEVRNMIDAFIEERNRMNNNNNNNNIKEREENIDDSNHIPF